MTKTLIAAAVVLMLPATVSAQDSTNSKKVSPFRKGNLSFGSNFGGANLQVNPLAYNVALYPGAGYFLTDHWMLSGLIQAGISGAGQSAKYLGIRAGVGLGMRYHFGHANDKAGAVKRLRLFADAGTSCVHGWDRWKDQPNSIERDEDDYLEITIGGGFNYLLSNAVAFESVLTYRKFDLVFPGNGGNGLVDLQLGIRAFLVRR